MFIYEHISGVPWLQIDAKGLHTTPQKVEAIQQAPYPKNVQQLRSF